MIGTEALPAVPNELGSDCDQVALVNELARSGARLISRLLLALVLAVVSVLIPGAADRFLTSQLAWSDLLPAHRISLPRTAALAARPDIHRPTPDATGLV